MDSDAVAMAYIWTQALARVLKIAAYGSSIQCRDKAASAASMWPILGVSLLLRVVGSTCEQLSRIISVYAI